MTDSRSPLELLHDYARNWSSVGETCGPRCTHKVFDALAAVLALHADDGKGYCSGCEFPYPCETVDAITEALEKTS